MKLCYHTKIVRDSVENLKVRKLLLEAYDAGYYAGTKNKDKFSSYVYFTNLLNKELINDKSEVSYE